MTIPYTVQVTRRGERDEHSTLIAPVEVISLVAVEHMEAVYDACADALHNRLLAGDAVRACFQIAYLPSSGGSIDLPREKIVVRRTAWKSLIAESGWEPHDNAYIDGTRLSARGKSSVLAAWNARCGKGGQS